MDCLNKYTQFLGKELEVIIDRPLGGKHPTLDFVYEVNYGFVPETEAGDGHEIDVWVLGVDEPVTRYTAKCIAVIIRHNDNENKLVLSSVSQTREQVMNKIGFVENYYQTEILFFDKQDQK
ncbi:MAG: inorganic diphosphatase [Pseudomonadales bacterium]|nr:inorganic diphosphatase [Pseudomonadales bacterium]